MRIENVIEFLHLCKENDLDVVIDGGWGVDALLGKQTRPHQDLDIAIDHKDVPKLRELLEQRGFADIPRDDTRDCNFVLGDNDNNKIDIHSYTFNEKGNNIFGVPYLPEHFTGRGTIGGYPVKCISAEWMIKFHSGYELDENDYHDMLALCQAFDFPLPSEFEKFYSPGQ
jgi:lincosamide nucleotidyltransferase A/C/D/E